MGSIRGPGAVSIKGYSWEGGSLLVCGSTLAYTFFMVWFLLPLALLRLVDIVLFFFTGPSLLHARR